MKKLHWADPVFSSTTVRETIPLGVAGFKNLRCVGDPEHRIPPTAGTTTRDAAWSLTDAAKLAVIRELETAGFRFTAKGRRQFYDDIDADTIEAAYLGRVEFLGLTSFGFVTGSNAAQVFHDAPSRAVVVLDLHSTVREFVDRLERKAV